MLSFCLDVKKTGTGKIDVTVSAKQVSDTETTEQAPEQRQPHEDTVGKLCPLTLSPVLDLVLAAMYHGANMINFSMCDKFIKKGWIISPDERKDPEGFTLLQWAKGRLSKIIQEK